jgi:hypothetical protein
MDVESQEGVGTEVMIFLPLPSEDQAAGGLETVTAGVRS